MFKNREKGNTLKKRTFAIVKSDRKNDEIKRVNQKILKNEDIYKQLNLAIADIGLTFMKAMENLKRNTEKIGMALKETNKSSQSS